MVALRQFYHYVIYRQHQMKRYGYYCVPYQFCVAYIKRH